MYSTLYVTTKDFCKRAWFGALLAVGTLVMGPLLFVVLTRLQGLNLDFMEHDLSGYHFAYLGLSWIAFMGVCLHALAGSQKICLGLPVSSRAIASWLMFSMVGLAVVLQLLTNGFYRVLFFDKHWLADYWPLLGPLMFLVTLILVGHCLFWSLSAPSFTRMFLGAGLIGAMLWWFISRYYPSGFQAAVVPWSHVSLSEFVTMQVVCIAAWYQGTRAFGKIRSGDALPSRNWESMLVWWNVLVTGALPAASTPFLCRWTALSRLHWRDSCRRAVIVGGLLIGLFSLMINLLIGANMNSMRPDFNDAAAGFLIFTIIFSYVASVVVAALLGEGMTNPGRTEMKRFLAMAPLIDEDLNALLFRNMIKTFTLVLVIIQCALFVSLCITAVWHGSEIFRIALNPRHLTGGYLVHILMTAVGFWIIAANLISIFWTGRKWFVYTAIGVCFGGFIFYVVTINLLAVFFPGHFLANFIIACLLLVPFFLILGGTLAAYVSACHKRLIGGLTAFFALLFWLIGVSVILIWLWDQSLRFHLQDQLGAACLYSALLALMIAPFATIPLALSWNRHR